MKKANPKFLFVMLLSLVVMLSVSACGGSEAAPSTDQEGSGAAPAEGAVVAEFTFTNTGSEEICELYLSPVSQNEWGVDQLAGQTILGGEKFLLKNIPAGSYDAKAVGCNGGEAVVQVDIK